MTSYLNERRAALAEAITQTAVGFAISWGATMALFPSFGWQVNAGESAFIVAIYTLLSLARGYLLRRAFQKWLKQ